MRRLYGVVALRQLGFPLATLPASTLRDWLRDAGFSNVVAFGQHGEPLRFDGRRLVIIATR